MRSIAVIQTRVGYGQASSETIRSENVFLRLWLRQQQLVFAPLDVEIAGRRLHVAVKAERGSYPHYHRAWHCRSTSCTVFFRVVCRHNKDQCTGWPCKKSATTELSIKSYLIMKTRFFVNLMSQASSIVLSLGKLVSDILCVTEYVILSAIWVR